MACVTLKRTHDFDLLDTDLSKRQKYSRQCVQEVTEAELKRSNSPFVPNEHYSQVLLRKRVKEELKRLQRRRLAPRLPSRSNELFSASLLRNADAVASCSGSLRSLALRSPQGNNDSDSSDSSSASPPHRANLDSPAPTAAFPPALFASLDRVRASRSGAATGFDLSPSSSSMLSPTVASSPLSSSKPADTTPIFTLAQVIALADRLIKDREDELRDEYDSILQQKLAEQYDAFVKFSEDQVSNRFQNEPMSYVS